MNVILPQVLVAKHLPENSSEFPALLTKASKELTSFA